MTRHLNSVFSTEQNEDWLNKIISTQSRLAQVNFDLTGFMNLVVNQMHELTGATGVVVELVEVDEMVYSAAMGTVKEYIGLHLPISNSISGLCVKQCEVLRSDDTEVDPRVNLEACRRVKARSIVVAPLLHDKKPIGVLKIISRNPDAFNERDVQTLVLMAGLIASGIAHQTLYENNQKLLCQREKAIRELKKAKKQLENLAHFDSLTKLPNRVLFDNRLEIAMARSKRYQQLHALMFLDLDHFKTINDNLGHHIGDLLLKSFANRLIYCIRASDTAARLGGDEFIILLEDIADKEAAVLVAKKIVKTIQEPFDFPAQSLLVTITTSMGVTLFRGNGLLPTVLLKQADDALYTSKKQGRNTFTFYEEKNEPTS